MMQPLAGHPDGELPGLPRDDAHRRLGGDHVVDLELARRGAGFDGTRHTDCPGEHEPAHHRHHRMPQPHVRSIAGSVRLLYIALAAALGSVAVGPSGIGPAQAEDACTAAPDGTLCPDDQVPCTIDRCATGVCAHVDVPDRITCDPVLTAYGQTLELGRLVGELEDALSAATLPDVARVLVRDALDGTAGDLARSTEVLGGRIDIPPPAAGETLAQARARSGYGIARTIPPRVRSVMLMLAVPGVRASGGPAVVELAQRTRFLYRGANRLKRELRRLQRVSGVFTR